MVELLRNGEVLVHPFVIGEIALGSLRNRSEILRRLASLDFATAANDTEVIDFIVRHDLGGSGIGYVDAHLLASVRLSDDAIIWTRDRRLEAAAVKAGVVVRHGTH